MNFLITGGTGFVGKQFIQTFTSQDHHFYVFTRTPEKYEATSEITYLSFTHPSQELPQIDAVINLAGESIFGYWTAKKKERILSSRLETTKKLLTYVKQLPKAPSVWINASAIGFYGTSDEKQFTEKTTEPGDDFLAEVVYQWEETAREAEKSGIRTVFLRFGIILGHEGSLPIMRLPVKLLAGGKIATGEQWMSWVHIHDTVQLIMFAINTSEIAGALNVTAPEPVQNKDFMKLLAKSLKRPYWFPTPGFAMKTVLGEMSELVTKGQFVIPQKALDHQYTFAFPQLKEALDDLARE